MSWWTSPTLHPKTKNRFVVVFSNAFYLPNVKSLNKPSVDIETKEYRLLNHTFNYPGNAKWKPVTLKFVDMNGRGSKELFFDTSAFLWQMLNNTGYAYPYFDGSSIREPMYRNVGSQGQNQNENGHHIATKITFDDLTTTNRENTTWRTITSPEKSSNIANSFGAGLSGEIDMVSASSVRQRVAIYQVSPDGLINEAWYLINPIVKSINWGDLSYEDDALTEYELQIVYDWAVLDRTVIGSLLNIDEEPYKKFMSSLLENSDVVDQEIFDRATGGAFGEDDGPIDVPQDLNLGDAAGIPQSGRIALSAGGTLDGGGNAEGLGTSNLFQPRESNYDSIQKPESQIDFGSMSAPNPDSSSTPIEYIDESYRPATPSPSVTQPETQYSTNRAPSEPSVRTGYAGRASDIEFINQTRKEAGLDEYIPDGEE